MTIINTNGIAYCNYICCLAFYLDKIDPQITENRPSVYVMKNSAVDHKQKSVKLDINVFSPKVDQF